MSSIIKTALLAILCLVFASSAKLRTQHGCKLLLTQENCKTDTDCLWRAVDKVKEPLNPLENQCRKKKE